MNGRGRASTGREGKEGSTPLPMLVRNGHRTQTPAPEDGARCQEQSFHPSSPRPGTGAVSPVSLPRKLVAGILSFLLSSKEYLISKVQSVSLPQEFPFPLAYPMVGISGSDLSLIIFHQSEHWQLGSCKGGPRGGSDAHTGGRNQVRYRR